MLKKLLVIVAVVAIGATAYGVARAYFSSPATSTAALTAGTININIEGHGGGYNAVPFSMTNWMPGQTQDVVFDVKNNSTVPVTLAGEVSGTWGELGDHFVSVQSADYWNGSAWTPLNADSHGTFTYADYGSSTLINVPAGGTATMRMTAKFDPAATNDYQGKTYSATIKVTGTQVL